MSGRPAGVRYRVLDSAVGGLRGPFCCANISAMKAIVESPGAFHGSYRRVEVECSPLVTNEQREFFWQMTLSALRNGFDVTIEPVRRAFNRW